MNGPGNARDGDQYRPPVSHGENPPGYDQGPGYGGPGARPRNGFGIAALVLGLLALVLCWTIVGGILFGILAMIFGLLGRARAKRGEATNGGVSLAGIVLGIIGLLAAIGLVALGASLLNSPAGQNYQQCEQQAGGDPAKLQQCFSEFGNQVGGHRRG
ncbi:MAG: DUF4190 domain-containing protein [Pseudonocardiales bacterium]|nr:MAG: DUF4190 domain-containing protein [Pseudonocardiales bacterium]